MIDPSPSSIAGRLPDIAGHQDRLLERAIRPRQRRIDAHQPRALAGREKRLTHDVAVLGRPPQCGGRPSLSPR